MSKFKAGDPVLVDGMDPAKVVSDEACMVRFDDRYREYAIADARLTLIPPEPPDYDAEIVAAAEAIVLGYRPCGVACSHPRCRLVRLIEAKRAVQDAE